jgi:hypothetical protein
MNSKFRNVNRLVTIEGERNVDTGGEFVRPPAPGLQSVNSGFSLSASPTPIVDWNSSGPFAALVPMTEDTDLEALTLSQNKRFWNRVSGSS